MRFGSNHFIENNASSIPKINLSFHARKHYCQNGYTFLKFWWYKFLVALNHLWSTFECCRSSGDFLRVNSSMGMHICQMLCLLPGGTLPSIAITIDTDSSGPVEEKNAELIMKARGYAVHNIRAGSFTGTRKHGCFGLNTETTVKFLEILLVILNDVIQWLTGNQTMW